MRVLADLVHDFKNPLATIALDMYWLQEQLGEQQELRNAVRRVTRNIAFLDRLVHDILDLDGEDMDLALATTDLAPLIEDVVDRTTSTHDRPRVMLDVKAMPSCEADEVRIQRVVANLLGNALKYSPPMCSVIVRLESIERFARVSVIDTGPGILPDEATTVFERHWRSEHTRCLSGNGLGLYVCKRIIDAHHGRIGVLSTRGAGSCFYFDLPV